VLKLVLTLVKCLYQLIPILHKRVPEIRQLARAAFGAQTAAAKAEVTGRSKKDPQIKFS